MRVAFKTGLVEPRRNEESLSLSLFLSLFLHSNGVLSAVPLSQGGLDILQAVAVHGYYISYAVIIADKRAHRVICAPAASEKRLLATVVRHAYTRIHIGHVKRSRIDSRSDNGVASFSRENRAVLTYDR